MPETLQQREIDLSGIEEFGVISEIDALKTHLERLGLLTPRMIFVIPDFASVEQIPQTGKPNPPSEVLEVCLEVPEDPEAIDPFVAEVIELVDQSTHVSYLVVYKPDTSIPSPEQGSVEPTQTDHRRQFTTTNPLEALAAILTINWTAAPSQ